MSLAALFANKSIQVNSDVRRGPFGAEQIDQPPKTLVCVLHRDSLMLMDSDVSDVCTLSAQCLRISTPTTHDLRCERYFKFSSFF